MKWNITFLHFFERILCLIWEVSYEHACSTRKPWPADRLPAAACATAAEMSCSWMSKQKINTLQVMRMRTQQISSKKTWCISPKSVAKLLAPSQGPYEKIGNYISRSVHECNLAKVTEEMTAKTLMSSLCHFYIVWCYRKDHRQLRTSSSVPPKMNSYIQWIYVYRCIHPYDLVAISAIHNLTDQVQHNHDELWYSNCHGQHNRKRKKMHRRFRIQRPRKTQRSIWRQQRHL
jgi:hypothetical protein